MPKVLVVDDERGILAVIEKFLRKKDFEVITADDGEKGLEAFDRDRSIDIIILDHKMPRLDGAGVLDGLTARKSKLPVILLTGSLGKVARKLRVDAFLTKPIDLDELLDKINELLGRQREGEGHERQDPGDR